MKQATVVAYLLSLISLFVYSYTQIDLNLTLSSNPAYQAVQNQLIHIGYFNRPLSTLLFFVILTSLFVSYFSLIYLTKNQKLNFSNSIKLVLTTSFILILAYPAFSHDIYNYIFDARIIVEHGANPYTHTALDFPADLWTRFMRWTHRTYPYGPTWLPLTTLFYVIGLGKFTLTLISFKLLGAVSYLISCFTIKNISHRYDPKSSNLSLVLFAFNPLIIIESLVTAHIDITMTAFMLLGLYFLTKQKLASWLFTLMSIGVKFATIALLPFLILFSRKKIKFHELIKLGVISLYLITIYIITQREILPWYFIPPFALTSLIPKNKFFTTLMIALSIATLIRYAPFLFIGDYTPWVKSARNISSTWVMALASLIYFLPSNSVSFRKK